VNIKRGKIVAKDNVKKDAHVVPLNLEYMLPATQKYFLVLRGYEIRHWLLDKSITSVHGGRIKYFSHKTLSRVNENTFVWDDFPRKFGLQVS
jgi:hypothetical protein